MELSSFIVFGIALAIAAIIPGPAIIALLTRVFVQGAVRNIGFGVGLILGDLIWMSAAIFGLAALATQIQWVFAILKYLGVAYLLFLAWKLWTAPPQIEGLAEGGQANIKQPSALAGIWGGISLGLSNPKPMLFYLALLPSLLDIGRVDTVAFFELSAILVVVLGSVLVAYMVAANHLRRLLRSSRALKIANRSGSVVVLGTAAYVAARA